jgi:hypothetical protein
MEQFVAKTRALVHGHLSGFDRMLFRGSLRLLSYLTGMEYFLSRKAILMKDFLDWAETLSKKVAAESAARAEREGRPVQYLASSATDKGQLALDMARRDGITEGLIGIFTCVEPCLGYSVYRNRDRKRLDLQIRQRKCLHHYHYLLHPQFGFCHVRLQTWVPFRVQVCLNGREWLGRQLQAEDIGYVKRQNSFVWIADMARAQQLLNAQLDQRWEKTLEGLLHEVIPSRYRWLAFPEARYYWSLEQSEWATDFLFRSPRALKAMYPSLVRHAMQSMGCEDILRFLGRVHPAIAMGPKTTIDVVGNLRRRPEGVRTRHRAGANSVKMYDKQGSVLRIETTINNIRDFREKRTDPQTGKVQWRRLRKGVVALRRRAQISQAVNNRYANALAAASTDIAVGDLFAEMTHRVTRRGYRYRALNPWAEHDQMLFRAIANGNTLTNGFRNRDLRALFYPHARTQADQRRASAAISRKLALLRAHRLIRKVSGSHRYQLTDRGRQITAAILNVHPLSVQEVLKNAA